MMDSHVKAAAKYIAQKKPETNILHIINYANKAFSTDLSLDDEQKVESWLNEIGVVRSGGDKFYLGGLGVERQDVNSYLEVGQFVYVLGCYKHEICKIGYTSSLEERLTQLKNQAPFKLFEIKILYDRGLEYEKFLHNEFRHLNTKNEWFKIDDGLNEWLKYSPKNTGLRTFREMVD